MAGKIEARLAELGIELPEAAAPAANYVPYVLEGGTLYIRETMSALDNVRIEEEARANIYQHNARKFLKLK